MTNWIANVPPAAAVAIGAALGAVLRWQIGAWINPMWSGFPLGTVLVNLIGGLGIGVALAWFGRHPDETLRLLWVTGVLGGFTTFSAFSAESLALIERGDWGAAVLHALVHVLGALACAALGVRLMRTCLF